MLQWTHDPQYEHYRSGLVSRRLDIEVCKRERRGGPTRPGYYGRMLWRSYPGGSNCSTKCPYYYKNPVEAKAAMALEAEKWLLQALDNTEKGLQWAVGGSNGGLMAEIHNGAWVHIWPHHKEGSYGYFMSRCYPGSVDRSSQCHFVFRNLEEGKKYMERMVRRFIKAALKELRAPYSVKKRHGK